MTQSLIITRTSLAEAFQPKANALNAIRLMLATGVILWHSFPLTGGDIADGPLRQLLANVWVDGFFAISGYLIVSSWIRHPKWWEFLRARFLRILPGFYACLIVTAAVIAPAAILLSGGFLPADFWTDGVGYVVRNAALRITQYGIAGTPLDVPYPGVWNGSLWTLWWEFLCYLGVLVLGVSSLIRRAWVLPCAFLVCLVAVIATGYGPVDNFYLAGGARFGVMFVSGALIYRFQDRIPASWPLVGVAFAVTIASAWLPDYRLLAALPLGYALIVTGTLLRHRVFWFRNDISYGIYIYAFPVQQCIAIFGGAALGAPLFALLSIALTVPCAIASWFWIERPSLQFRKRRHAARA
ncbi:acyltransferase family protein [Glaciibacter superstes]|uniref:acyltransferase family protein n=1 Tax=Glaciibacter superstes TaxID=501023 RepID=UPI0003B65685|nr:acyltransferase [Glaciibacter superstes]